MGLIAKRRVNQPLFYMIVVFGAILMMMGLLLGCEFWFSRVMIFFLFCLGCFFPLLFGMFFSSFVWDVFSSFVWDVFFLFCLGCFFLFCLGCFLSDQNK